MEKRKTQPLIIPQRRRPKVLLLGNGLNRVLGGASWQGLLDRINKTQYSTEQVKGMPFPMQAVLLSNDHIDISLKDMKSELSRCELNPWLAEQLRALLSMPFDCVLTANFTYEAECSLDEKFTEVKSRRLRYLRHTPAVPRAESSFMLSTYYEFPAEQGVMPLFHIHGEACKPDSMILGHYYYGNLLFRFDDYLSRRAPGSFFSASERKGGLEVHSWLDYFILGDVYVLGFGFDTSEIDLWWLLCRKKRELAPHGAIHFFEPASEKTMLKHALLRAYDVRCISLGEKDIKPDEYRDFYEKAIEEIGWRVQGRPG